MSEVAPDTQEVVARAEKLQMFYKDYAEPGLLRSFDVAEAKDIVRDLLAALREAQGKLSRVRDYIEDTLDFCSTERIDPPPAIKRVRAILDEGEAPE